MRVCVCVFAKFFFFVRRTASSGRTHCVKIVEYNLLDHKSHCRFLPTNLRLGGIYFQSLDWIGLVLVFGTLCSVCIVPENEYLKCE